MLWYLVLQFSQPADEGLERRTSLKRAGSDLKDQVKAALERTPSFNSQLMRSTSAGAKEMLSALHHTASGNFNEASVQVQNCALVNAAPI